MCVGLRLQSNLRTGHLLVVKVRGCGGVLLVTGASGDALNDSLLAAHEEVSLERLHVEILLLLRVRLCWL